MTEALHTQFKDRFGLPPTAVATGHGRVNLIGEHTDYNDGLVLPCILKRQTTVALSLRADSQLQGSSATFGDADFTMDEVPSGHWLAYVRGAVSMLTEAGAPMTGVDILVDSTMPAGAGVSSSAAFEVALLTALHEAHDLPLPEPTMLARMAHRIDHEFIGLRCGIMDHMVCAVGAPGAAMMLDCRSMEYSLHAFPADHTFLVIHSGSGRKLSEGQYNERVAECEGACQALGISSLRDASAEDLSQIPDDLLLRRARHVVLENNRVTEAASAFTSGDMTSLGVLMNASHTSLAGDYAVSSDVLDKMVAAARQAGALGARLTGAGFGGCIVCLVRSGDADAVLAKVIAAVPKASLVDSITA